MTENKRYSFNWKSGHPNFWDNHCDLADCYLTCADVVDRLNELHEENQELKVEYADDCNEANSMTVKISELTEENEQLKQRNDRQAKQLDRLYSLIEEEDWTALSDIIDDFKRCEEQLQKEWGIYNESE